jgi:hypothetical protein
MDDTDAKKFLNNKKVRAPFGDKGCIRHMLMSDAEQSRTRSASHLPLVEQVRAALHVSPKAGEWQLCTDRIKYTHDIPSMIPIHKHLIAKGLRCISAPQPRTPLRLPPRPSRRGLSRCPSASPALPPLLLPVLIGHASSLISY